MRERGNLPSKSDQPTYPKRDSGEKGRGGRDLYPSPNVLEKSDGVRGLRSDVKGEKNAHSWERPWVIRNEIQ